MYGNIWSLSWYIATFVQKLSILDIFCPILDILDIELILKKFRFRILAWQLSFWCIMYGTYLVSELRYSNIYSKVANIGQILSNIGHIGYWIDFLNFRFRILTWQWLFWYLIYGTYLVSELRYNHICSKVANIGHILSNIGHIGYCFDVKNFRFRILACQWSFWCIIHGVYLVGTKSGILTRDIKHSAPIAWPWSPGHYPAGWIG